MAEWKEIERTFDSIKSTIAEKREQFELGEYGVVADFGDRVREIMSHLESLEGDIERRGIGSPDPEVRDKFKSILERLHSLAFYSIGGQVRTRLAKEGLEAIWGQGLLAITSFLERKAKAVGVESWSLAASVGFPMGVSGTVSINFKP